MNRLSTRGVAEVLVEAGALTEEQVNQIDRIVIDLPANGLPQIFVQMTAPAESVWHKLAPPLAPMLRAMVEDQQLTTPVPFPYKLGSNPSDLSRAPRLEDYLTAAHLPPSGKNVDRATNVSSWPIYLNDQLGDCTIAAAAHMFAAMAVYAGKPEPAFADAEIVRAYSAVSGYDPVTGANDNGADPVTVLTYLSRTGMTDTTGKVHKVAAWAAIRYCDSPGLATQVLNTFGSAYWAINCPQSAQQQFHGPDSLWTYDESSPIEGGHAIVLQRRRDVVPGIFQPVTWGALIRMRLDFFLNYLTESFAVVSEDWITANGDTIEGLNLRQLIADTALVK